MDVQMGYDQLRLTPGAWLDLLGGVWRWTCCLQPIFAGILTPSLTQQLPPPGELSVHSWLAGFSRNFYQRTNLHSDPM